MTMLPPRIWSVPLMVSVPLTSMMLPEMVSPRPVPSMTSLPPVSMVMVPPEIAVVSSSVSVAPESTTIKSAVRVLVIVVPELSVSEPPDTTMPAA